MKQLDIVTLLIVWWTINVEATRNHIELKRGNRGIVPCSPIQTGKFTVQETDTVYWSFRRNSGAVESPIISSYEGEIFPQTGNEDVYDINEELSLVIYNVTHSSEGEYSYVYKPSYNGLVSGSIDVSEIVSPNNARPQVVNNASTHVVRCHDDSSACTVVVPHDTLTFDLTCFVEYVKPAVNISWLRVSGNDMVDLNAESEKKDIVLHKTDTNCFWRNNTFNISATIQLPFLDDEATYVCQASGKAMGDNGKNLTVTVTRSPCLSTDFTTYEATTVAEPACLYKSAGNSTCAWIILAISLCLNVGFVLWMNRRRIRLVVLKIDDNDDKHEKDVDERSPSLKEV